MMRWIVALTLLLAGALPLSAQAVRVRSGEHGDFTRIVLEFPGAADWRVGRTADGYRLRLADAAPSYDLSGVYDLIGRSRLAAIWADPENGDLSISLACACHVIPFEFRPGTVVIDLKDGPPPSGSSFEDPIDGDTAPGTLEARPNPRPQPRPEVQMAQADQTPDGSPDAPLAPVPPTDLPQPDSPAKAQDKDGAETALGWASAPADPTRGLDGLGLSLLDRNLNLTKDEGSGLEPLREALIAELGRGATQGIIEMAPPEAGQEAADDPADHGDGQAEEAGQAPVAIRLGDSPNLDLRQKGEAREALGSQGVVCIPDDKLAISDWADTTPVAEQMGPKLLGLIGEFDKPVPEAVATAVRFYLHLGFGAEARALLRGFPSAQEDEAIWRSMAEIIDGSPLSENAFAGMAACDTAAALWALLADPEVLALGQVEKAAVLRGFSALPRHLRQEFGPRLVERFLDMKDLVSATALREAVLRGAEEMTPDIEMMEAALEHAGGSPAASENRLSDLAETQGNADSRVLAELVIQRAELGQTVGYDQVLALEAFLGDIGEGEERDRLDLALTLAHAASGDFTTAFDRLEDTPEAAPALWHLLARSGRDSPLLEHAVLPADTPLPKAARPVATLIAQRLITLGLAEPAARWLSMEGEPPPLLAAKVALGRGQAERALQLLGEEAGKSADELRLAALRHLRDEKAVAALSAEQGLEEEAWRAVSRQRDWPRLAAEGPEAWKTAAQHLLGLTPAEAAAQPGTAPTPGQDAALAADPLSLGPLERDRRLVAESEALREAISTLLDSVEAPPLPMN